MANERVKFIYGLQAKYDALAAGVGYDNDTLYIITDTQKIYKGATLIGQANEEQNVIFTAEAPEASTAKENTVYVVSAEGRTQMMIKNSDQMEVVSGGELEDGAVSSIDKIAADVILKSTDTLAKEDDEHLVTAGAVANAIETGLKDYAGGAFTGVTATRVEKDEMNPSAGTVLQFTTAGGESTAEVRIADLFLAGAEYDNVTHELKLSVQGSDDPVTVNLEDLVPQACSTADVSTTETIVATVAVGNIKKGQEIPVQDLQSLLVSIFSSDSMPTVTQPSLSLSGADEIKEYEVGTVLDKIDFSATLAKGGYSQTAKNNQVQSGITPTKWTFECTGQDSQEFDEVVFTKAVEFAGLTVEDGTNVSVKATAAYTAGDEVPLTYLGKTELDGTQTTTKRIASGSKSANRGTIKGYRNCYYGFKGADNLIADPANITVEEIKALTATRNLPGSLTASGMQQMFFAVPKTKASSLTIMGANPPAPQDVTGPIVVQVGGVGGHAPIDYNVWYVNNAGPTSGSDTYTFTWK